MDYKSCFNRIKAYFEIPAEQRMEVVLQEDEVLTCHLRLPVMPKKELAEAIRWELPLHLPYAKGSYFYDYFILNKMDGMQNIQVFVILKEVVDELDKKAKEQSLVLTSISIAGYEDKSMNLLPDACQRKRVPLTKLYRAGALFVCCLGACLLLGDFIHKEIQKNKLDEVNAKLGNIRVWQERYDLYKSREKSINVLEKRLEQLEQERILWNEVLGALGGSTPKNCWLTHVKQSEGKRIEVQGKAEAIEQVQKLITNIKSKELFTSVKLVATDKVKDNYLGYRIILTKGE